MDEITLINLLNEICDKNTHLTWSLSCKFQDGSQNSIMEIDLYQNEKDKNAGSILFKMESWQVIQGRYRSMMPFREKTSVVDALLLK